jgi:hypothetical protein
MPDRPASLLQLGEVRPRVAVSTKVRILLIFPSTMANSRFSFAHFDFALFD